MGFKKIFIGTIFVLLDFRIQFFDILPDFIGYIIIFIGLSEIIHLNSKFSDARFISLILIVLSISDIYPMKNHFLFIPLPYNFHTIFIIFSSIIYLIYSYCLFIGIKECAENISDVDLANKAQMSWILALVSSVAGAIVLLIPIFFIIVFLLVIVTLVVQLLTLSMAKKLV